MLRILLSLFLCVSLAAHAQTGMVDEGERVVRVEPQVRDGKLYIDADGELAVTGDLRHIAQKGVPVYFTADVEIVSEDRKSTRLNSRTQGDTHMPSSD